MIHRQRTACRACGGQRLRRFLSLGPTPLANAFLRSEAEFACEPRFPLDVYFCESCTLVQLVDVIDPEALFRNYIYVKATSETIAEHNSEYAATLSKLLALGPRDLVVEVASNDGSLLKCFQAQGARILGIEPAINIAHMAQQAGVETMTSFFDAELARRVRAERGPARAVVGNNVLAHVDDTQDFLRGCRELLADDGLVVIEVPYLRDFLDRLEYDTVYHEHLCYFSVRTLLALCDAVGLAVVRIDRLPIHGGSLRLYAARAQGHAGHAPQALELIAEEQAAGLNDFARYERFAADVADSRRALVDLLATLKSAGKTIAGYGAPAKGNTLLNYCGIGTDVLDFTVDKNPLKIGLFTPGQHLRVLRVEAIDDQRPDYLLVLAWNLADEIFRQQLEFRRRGGRFILPIPRAQVV